MRKLLSTTQFKKDLKKSKKRGKDTRKIQSIIEQLIENKALASNHKPHRLTGNWSYCWECHIESDWLLIWDEDKDTVTLIRTGTHSDLFE
jgi:mRNA interferase YafQ